MGNLLYALNWVPSIIAFIDFYRRRPEWYWLLVLFFFGTPGAILYLLIVVLPGMSVSGAVAMTFSDRRRKRELERQAESEPLPGGLAELGELLYRDKEYARAVVYLNKAIEQGIDHDESRYYLGRSYEELGDYESAMQHLVKVVRTDPRFKFGEAMLSLGRVCEALGHVKDAEAAYAQVLANHTYAEARLRLALMRERAGRLPEARDLMRKIVADNLDHPRYIRSRERKFVSQAKSWLSAHPPA